MKLVVFRLNVFGIIVFLLFDIWLCFFRVLDWFFVCFRFEGLEVNRMLIFFYNIMVGKYGLIL